jgi:hypothetical protein
MCSFGWKALLITSGLMLAQGGCGYRFESAGTIPDGLEPIFIQNFENRTNELNLETTVTQAFVSYFTRRDPSALAANAVEARVLMRGVIRSIELQTISTRGRDIAGERRVTLSVDIQLVRPDGSVAWDVQNLTDNDAFAVTNDKLLNDDRQRATLLFVAGRMAERFYSRLVGEF